MAAIRRQAAEKAKAKKLASGPPPFVSVPLLMIWLRPKRTIRSVLAYNSYLWVPILAPLTGISGQILGRLGNRDGMLLAQIVKSSLMFGSIVGVLQVFIWSVIPWATGKMFGGKAGYRDVSVVAAWSTVPHAYLGALIFGLLPVFELDLFRNPRRVEVNSAVAITQMGLGLTALVVVVWSIVLYLGGFAAAQGFRLARTLACLLVIVAISIAVLVALFLVLAAVGFALIGLVAGT